MVWGGLKGSLIDMLLAEVKIGYGIGCVDFGWHGLVVEVKGIV